MVQDAGTGRKTGFGAGGGSAENAKIFTRRDQDAHDYKWVYQRTAWAERFGGSVREASLGWLENEQRWDGGYIGYRMLNMGLPGRRIRERRRTCRRLL